MKKTVILFIKIYQYFFSRLFFGCCRFYPSCSEYALACINSQGVIRGGWLTVKRVARCNPIGGFGFDPAPEREQ